MEESPGARENRLGAIAVAPRGHRYSTARPELFSLR
jgi:hypothetical protein